MIRLELHADTHAELIAQMAAFMAVGSLEQPSKRTTRKVAESAQPSPTVQPAVTDNTGSAPAALPPTAEVAEGAGAAKAAPPLTLDIVRAKLQAVNTAKGMDAVKTILSEHGLQKVSAIVEKDFASIYAAAEKVLA